MGERKKKKGNLPVLTQPQSVSAEGNYYSVSWSVKLCGSGFLVLVLHGDSGGALMQFWASGGLSSFLGIFRLHSVSLLCLFCGAEPFMPLGSGVGLQHPDVLLFRQVCSALSAETLSLLSK